MNSLVASLKADEAVNWFQKRLNNAVNYGLSSEECNMFDIFITSTLADVDIKKQIINIVLPTFFDNLISRKVNKSTIDAQATLIRLFIKYYGGTCNQFKNALDKFTTKALSECFNEDNIVFKVTKYLALYPQCGGRGQQGIHHAEAWTCQFNDYLYSANYFLNQLYTNVNFFFGTDVTDNYEGKFDVSIFKLSELTQMTPKERYEKLTSLFIFFNTAIQSMLLSMFSTVKHFDSNKVIQFALCTLSVTSEKLNATMITEDVIALDSVLWKLHSSAIKTISALIKCCGRILIPQGTLICRILIQSLNMTHFNSSNAQYGTTRSKLQQRVLTYQVLCSWLAVAGSQSSLELFSESLTSGILFDIKFDKPSLNLVVDKQTGNKKRKSGALNQKIINQRDTIVMHDYLANKTVCNEAHKTLQLFLNTLSSNLKVLQFKIFQSTIMGLLLEIIKCQRPNDYPLPYYDDLCRLNLYKSLLALIISPHPQCITHTSVALRVFTFGTTDRNEKVKEACRSSLSELEHIIRPRNDTLFFPLENDIEIPPCAQSTIPENKTHFLNEIVEDSTVPIQVKELKNVQPNIIPQSTQSNLSENKTEIINEIVEDSTIPIKGKEVKIINTKNVQPNTIPQSVQNTIPENKTNIFNKTVKDSALPIEVKTLFVNVNTENVQPNTVIETMDADNSMDSSSVDESLINKDLEDEDCTDMLNDFIDSD
ncbi:proline-, glutamic acid- and leucine-rich protein 1 [Acyrthosiphon pisum]|uniref:Proline-, glutamic acid- and leucine-rich protein 1 n=1 Tax=Acyrthosiphon pisum TaxID=7029 RepID=A0A8R1W0S0_ACYPI|nr:proline-, glutamic acid- and leucine-rich protein 1 [Acyrthosiphon pisum]|eukprot:XP_001943884.1 PREDICTED: proline-, glutamic acid- and leucine-rich protein 1 [Acyrthosiphon pisum]